MKKEKDLFNPWEFFDFGRTFSHLLPPLVFIGLAVFTCTVLFRYVDLKPRVEPNFFFSEKDPAFQEDLKIRALFPEPEQIVISASGPIRTPEYAEKIRKLSLDLFGLSPVFGVQSLVMGPERVKDAFSSPLWKRVLFSRDGRSTVLVLFMDRLPSEELISQIERIAAFYQDENFRLIISGTPYVIDLIRRHLFEDLKIFSAAAFLVFSIVMLFIFRSIRILLGTIISCAVASSLTLIIAQWLEIGVGPLTANLSTIVFVLSLSHIAYMTFNWKHLLQSQAHRRDPTLQAVRITIVPSFWSMFTTFLGFLTLMLVEAAPLQKLGVSGAIGTLVSFVVVFLVYPWFLRWKTPHLRTVRKEETGKGPMTRFFSKRHPSITVTAIFIVIYASFGFKKIDRDPALLSYFKEGTYLRQGLDYLDRNWGSSTLKVVISDAEGRLFDDKRVYRNLWNLQEAIEDYPPVGGLISLSLLMAEAKERIPLSFLVKWKWILDHMEKPEYFEIAKYFVTADRKKSLLLIRMSTLVQDESRFTVIENILEKVREEGFVPEHIGGIYYLQGKLARLIITSLLSGLGLLIILFVMIGLLMSLSVPVAFAMFISLLMIPAWLIGVLGNLHVPIDMISAPGTNLAIAMGVDAMVHLLSMVRRCINHHGQIWDAWAEARARLWKPVLSSAGIVSAGFAIFALSNFPPTQRFGFAVVVGTVMAPIATLFVMPTLSGTRVGRRKKPDPLQEAEEANEAVVQS